MFSFSIRQESEQKRLDDSAEFMYLQKPIRFISLGRTRLAFARRIPGLKGVTWGTLRVSSLNRCETKARGV
jgi:hypothetical protein